MMRDLVRALLFSFILVHQASVALAQNLCANVFQEEVHFGVDFNQRVYEAFQSAQKSLDVEMTAIPDEAFNAAILGRAEAGVKVRLIFDGRHYSKSVTFRNKFNNAIHELSHPNIELRISSPQELSEARGFPAAVLHRKIAIIDGELAYMGSSNLTNYNNYEVALLTRTQVNELQQIFDHDFQSVTRRWQGPEIALPLSEKGDLTFVGPGTQKPDIKKSVLELIDGAQTTLWISAMEIADRDVVKALIKKHREYPDLDLRVVMSHAPMNYPLAGKLRKRAMNLPAANALIKAGIPVKWYEVPSGAVIHGRTVLTDTQAMAGSADLTKRSFDGNVELSFISKNESLNGQIKNGYLNLWEISTPAKIEKESLESFIATRFENWIVPLIKPQWIPKELR